MIHAIYKGLTEESPWVEVAKFLSLYMDATSAVIVIRPSSSTDLGYLVCQPANPPVERIYQAELWRHDPFLDLPLNKILTIDEYVGDEKWLKSDFYREVFGQYGSRYGLGVNLISDSGTVFRLRLYRMSYEQPFSQADKARLEALLPHFQQALALANRLELESTQNELYEGALNRLHIGSVVLDENQQVLRCNQVARAMLDEGDGLRWSGNSLDAHYRNERHLLKELMESGSLQPQVISITRPSGKRKLGLVVRSIPLRKDSEGKCRPAWIIFLCDPDVQTKAPREVMRQVFEFTPAEANLAMELANGMSLDEAAELLGIRRNTARTHLRAIFAKAGVTRQAELVRLVLNGVISLSSPSA
ncbi:helix-turn-helix transcriptional regulator [Pseudomonas sp. 5P_3.1_Bac2]|uniref:helix-turn-helix transcriptional regulator n=1 Tax=Pseudomonas sp. 5P_3.1_Bac2 TaxID=2971617 RepID=UPI0021C896D1|nr:helix-turn-helix transcriptional regulator [Pseudomonas sp. 5P_3.1_Bac2]MCU1717658.1 helix-turn-helix transcriptional regulator [Pseudomonas sp. 5P_3.1_Bac2]